MRKTIAVLVPTARPRVKEVSIAPPVHDLNDKVLGFLWNSKPNGDILLRRIEELLSRRFHLAGTRWHQKPSVALAADAAAIEELTSTADVVINAIGD